MKVLFFISMLSAFCTVGLAKAPQYPVHILPDQAIHGYDSAIQLNEMAQTSYVSEAIRVGKVNMDWLKHMNSSKPDDQKIALTKPGELTPIPIDKPKVYSPETIEADFKGILAAIPENMKAIIFEGAAFTSEPGQDLETYILWAKKVDKMYQTASRWTLIFPHLAWYSENKQNDIRGYYYLAKEEKLNQKLEKFSELSQEEKTRLSPLLVNMCENTMGVNMGCETELANAVQNEKVYIYYLNYYSTSKNLYDSVFQIQATRPDLTWAGNNAIIPIRVTPSEPVNQFLQMNIEDEWKWNDWKLRLNFTSDADIHVEFAPGQTPHVNGLAGNKITMDGNAPLTEWDVQWTIRHEFGHVLGFPDCYVEFYDSNLKALVNYQIDTANLMCSRAGKMQELHYNEMKKNYSL